MSIFTLTLLRHGETTSPKSLNGATNVDLSIKGQQQMLAACNTLSDIDYVSSSPLQRCERVANIMAKKWKVPYEIHHDLQEMNFGDWDGILFDTLFEKYPDDMSQFFNDPWQTNVPNGEQVESFYNRLDKVWLAHIALEKNALLVCHGGVIRYLISKVLGMPRTGSKHINSLKIDYAAIVQINIFIDETNVTWPTLVWPTIPITDAIPVATKAGT